MVSKSGYPDAEYIRISRSSQDAPTTTLIFKYVGNNFYFLRSLNSEKLLARIGGVFGKAKAYNVHLYFPGLLIPVCIF